MPIRVTCPSCSRSLRVPERLVGLGVKCPACFAQFTAAEENSGADFSGYRPALEDNEPVARKRRPAYSDYDDDDRDERDDRDDWDDDDRRRRRRRRRRADKESAGGRLFGPAIGLLSTAILGILFGLLCLIAGPAMFGDAQNADEKSDAIITIVYGLVHLIASLLAIAGAIAMLRLKIYNLAVGGCVVALVPAISPCCVLGVPFGIWGMIVLNDREVKRAFS
jgi:hypothetical protein